MSDEENGSNPQIPVDYWFFDSREDFDLNEICWYLADSIPYSPIPPDVINTPQHHAAKLWGKVLLEWEQQGRLKVTRKKVPPQLGWNEFTQKNEVRRRGYDGPPTVKRADLVAAFEKEPNGKRPAILFPESREQQAETSSQPGGKDAAPKPSHLKLIGVLIRLLVADDPDYGDKKTKHKNREALKEYITENFKLRGLGDRNLETLFAEASKSLQNQE